MSHTAVVEFCQQVSKTPELRTRIESGVKAGAGWELLVTAAHECGFEFTVDEAIECFELERQRRAALESSGHTETRILKKAPTAAPVSETLIPPTGTDGKPLSHADAQNLASLRRIALSHDWHIDLSPPADVDDESIFS